MVKINREIKVLTDEEHLLLRPTMYIGSVEPQEEKIPIIENGRLVSKQKIFSTGLYKLLDEAIDNAIDEAKRCYAQNFIMKEIAISINTKTNEAIIRDTGMGFQNGLKINKKSGMNNIETAMTQLRAGSNFENENTKASLIGMNGVGISCTNVLSDKFSIITSDGSYEYFHAWEKFRTKDKNEKIFKTKTNHHGTTISFIPRKEIFKDQKWDPEIILTKLIFREFTRAQNKELSSLKITLDIDGKKIDLTKTFIPDTAISFENRYVKVWAWTDFPDAVSVSFVNGALCTGIHQKLVNEWINKNIFENFEKAHYFYKTCIIMNLPPKKIVFADQNKTKFVGIRDDLEPIISFKMSKKDFINKITKSRFYIDTLEKIYNSMQKENINVLKKAKKERAKKISEKFFSSHTQENLFIVEGGSAAGSINQARDPKIHAIYALRGKIKNVHNIQDLSKNTEIIDLMNILNLDITNQGSNCKWKKIIIAVDQDPDGIGHIASLILHFFYKWFPKIIQQGKLFILKTPLISIDGSKNKRFYYYSLADLANIKDKKKIRYLKGLGSLSIQDWKYIFENMELYRIIFDTNSEHSMEIAFGDNIKLRKKWLAK